VGYKKEKLRLNSERGWCSSSTITGTNTSNWVTIDLKSPSVIRGFRTQGVRRHDGRLGFPTAISRGIHQSLLGLDSQPVKKGIEKRFSCCAT
jgi:hypothetical protein